MADDEPVNFFILFFILFWVLLSRHISSSDTETPVLVAFEINVDGRERFDEQTSNCDFHVSLSCVSRRLRGGIFLHCWRGSGKGKTRLPG